MGDFPFVESYIFYYSLVTFNSDLYLFGKILVFSIFEQKINLGGYGDGSWSSNMVAKMDKDYVQENAWTNAGTLLALRTEHRSIVIDNNIYHIGGYGSK